MVQSFREKCLLNPCSILVHGRNHERAVLKNEYGERHQNAALEFKQGNVI